jgi:hypothetical protein
MTDPTPKPVQSIDDLLTPEQREKLHADLMEMAKLRRQAEAAALNVMVGS